MEESKTQVLFNNDARRELFKGLEVVAKCVGTTLGPRGKTVIIQCKDKPPIITKDGITVSKSIKLKDSLNAMGASLILEAASRTNDIAGDGTTTATVLTHALVKEGLQLLSSGHDANALVKGISKATQLIVQQLKENSRSVFNRNEIAQVATISANGDRDVGELLADAMEKVGSHGIITVEDAKGMNTSLDVIEGMQFNRGYLSPYFVTNNEKMHATYQNVKVLIADKKLNDLRELIPILEKFIALKPTGVSGLLIIAEDIEGEALQGLILNKIKSALPVIAVKAPEYGIRQAEMLEDLCALTGATLVSSKLGTTLKDASANVFGSIKRVIVDATNTTIINDASVCLNEHIQNLQNRLNDVTLDAINEAWLRERIAKLSGGVAVIRVGGLTEMEMIEKKYRIEDALHATKAATEEGIVPGGGTALWRAARSISSDDIIDRNELAGFKATQNACAAPLRLIVENSGVSADVVINELTRLDDVDGYNAATREYVKMFDVGIIDPLKVSKTALMHAASIAEVFLTLDAAIYEHND